MPALSSCLRYCYFDLSQQIHHLLRLVLLPSSHMLSLSSCLLSTGTFQAGHSTKCIHYECLLHGYKSFVRGAYWTSQMSATKSSASAKLVVTGILLI
jgi:hypothetical protein